MQNDRLNKILQEKMSGFSELPSGTNFNIQASWQKLEERLPAQKRRGGWWYGSAAAALIAIMAALFFLRNNDKQTGYANRNEHPLKVPAAKTVTPVAKEPVTAETTVVRNQKKEQAVQDKSVQTSSDTTTTAVPPQLAVRVTPDTIAASATMNTVNSNVASVTNSKLVQPKSIKVIHLNELNDDPYYRENTQKGASNFSFTTPFRTEKNTEPSETRKLRFRFPVTVN